MAIPRALVASIFLALLAVHGVQALQTNQLTSNAAAEAAYTPKIDCGSACAARCKLSSRPNLCKRACGTCCARCSCVPPGTYGNYDACPCYASLTTRDNKPKCP
ncbi:GAST1-like protein 1 [Perilla frutescens var. hirtella]|uniref:GAST1-like protein 1 n=1 Tax=Perilla frutescens var. hirtella TaxID=608512 RepID=A0AAD4IRN2_PERFH|nr:GAST1-like protein 1 [Perilla frutescens var. hirtella]